MLSEVVAFLVHSVLGILLNLPLVAGLRSLRESPLVVEDLARTLPVLAAVPDLALDLALLRTRHYFVLSPDILVVVLLVVRSSSVVAGLRGLSSVVVVVRIDHNLLFAAVVHCSRSVCIRSGLADTVVGRSQLVLRGPGVGSLLVHLVEGRWSTRVGAWLGCMPL